MSKQSDTPDDRMMAEILRTAERSAAPVDQEALERIRRESTAAFAAHAASRRAGSLRTRAISQRVFAWALVAAAAFFAVWFVVPWAEDGRVRETHALEVAADLLLGARTLHWKETCRESVTGGTETVTEYHWRDRKRGLSRHEYKGIYRDPSGKLINHGESSSDGKWVLNVYHAGRRAGYYLVDPLRQQFEQRWPRLAFLERMGWGNPSRLRSFRRTGSEMVRDVLCHVWEGRVPRRTGRSGDRLVKAWVSSDGGMLVKLQVKAAVQGPDLGFQESTFEILAVDQPFPRDALRMEPPVGYDVTFSREQAAQEGPAGYEAGFGSFPGTSVHIGFTLPDGSLLLCWSSNDSGSERKSEAALPQFDVPSPEAVAASAQFPIFSVCTIGVPGEDVCFDPVHVAVTRGKTRERIWTHWTPSRGVPPRRDFYGYTLEMGCIGQYEGLPPGRQRVDFSHDFRVETAEDFDTFVRGIAAYYSSNGEAPPQLTRAGLAGRAR